ncbi:unnamed protein product [Caenorhabditis bovis]|uniref:Uncharacterized protein n=1 Tax=Caenorhabditis bovis TaxID=2654633 RepID=A0A8S1EZY1_9PELO|nr:unnamed protein product [Caenorhabditis bovis]
MPMYRLTPAFPQDFDVSPRNVMYRLPPYHDFGGSSSGGGAQAAKEETDPVKVLEKKQLALIEKLKLQTESLNKLLVSIGNAKASTPKSAPAPAEVVDGGKKDKEAKKEARKAAKSEAKSKVAAGATPKPPSEKASGSGWSVEDDRKTWETKLSLTVNLPPSLVAYPQENLGAVDVTITEADEGWAKALSAVGAKRNVAFNGVVCNNVGKGAKTTVTVKSGDVFGLKIGETAVKCRQTAWKILGGALGLHSRQSAQTLSAAHQARWLEKADLIMHKIGDAELTEREASQFLARFDSLSSQWDVTVADIVIRHVIRVGTHPNNVELWAKKIDGLLV